MVGLVSAANGSESTLTFYLPAVAYDPTDMDLAEIGVPNVKEYTFEIDPNKPETLYLGTYGQQAWRTHNSGESWEVMGNGLPITGSVRSFATSPISPTLIYAEVLTWPYQIYRSLDGGDSWQGLSRVHGYRLLSLEVNPITPTILFAGASIFDSTTYGGEVYRSSDGGITWIQILPSFTMALEIVIDPLDPKVVYLGSSYFGLLKSVNGGDSWQQMNNGLPSDDMTVQNINLNPDDSQIIYITADSKLYRSSDGGGNWVSIGSGLPVPWISTLAMNPSSPQMMFATPVEGSEYYGVYQSTDEGYSWQWLASNPIERRAIEMKIQRGANFSLLVLFDGYSNIDERFWKLALVP
jgi:photosystem II stability/assembly factor-like uncharacterized protein